MIDWGVVWDDYIGLSLSGALGMLASTVVLYLFLTLLVHVAGPRLMATPSVASFAVLALIGSVSARSMLGDGTTLLGGLLVLNVIMLMEAVLGTIRRSVRLIPERAHTRPTVVMIDGRTVAPALRRRRLSERDLRERLRASGVLELHEAALVILEARGSLTVVRRGSRIDRRLVETLEGRDLVPEDLLA